MILWPVILVSAVAGADPAGPALQDAIAAVRRAGPDSESGDAAAKAWRCLATAGIEDLPILLAGMDGASPLARNWLRSAIDRVLERAAAEKRRPPTEALDAFLRDIKHDPQARRLAYDLLCDADPKAADCYLPGMLDDPSPNLRRDAVARLLDRADKLLDAGNKAKSLPLYRDALAAARERDQIDTAVRKLRGLGEKVDLKEALKDHADVAVYAAAEFPSKENRDVEIRLGCFTGFKLWVNGELVLERGDAYTGMQLDHYVAKARLRAGKNVLLLKIAQDQPPPQMPPMLRFQLRVCDAGGKAILAADGK